VATRKTEPVSPADDKKKKDKDKNNQKGLFGKKNDFK